MELLHHHLDGEIVLHWLTAAVPLAALLVAVGAIRPGRAGFVVLLAFVVTGATFQLASLEPAGQAGGIARFGAPLPFAKAPADPPTGALLGPLRVIDAYLFADVLFWASAGIVLATLSRLFAPRRSRVRSAWGSTR
jgi:hypothetical protein